MLAQKTQVRRAASYFTCKANHLEFSHSEKDTAFPVVFLPRIIFFQNEIAGSCPCLWRSLTPHSQTLFVCECGLCNFRLFD